MERHNLIGCRLFDGLMFEEILSLCGCLGAERLLCERGLAEAREDSLAVLAAGCAVTASGRIVGSGEALVLFKSCPVLTSKNAELLVFSAAAVGKLCGRGCAAHRRLASNAIEVLFGCLDRPIRGLDVRRQVAAVLLVYGEGESSFRLPLTRSQLASCLGCQRQELVRELERLRHENIIGYSNRDFTLENKEALLAVSSL